MTKLPPGSAEVRIDKIYDVVPEDEYQCQIIEARVKEVPESIRKRYGITQTHTVSVTFIILTGKYTNHVIYMDLYPIVDMNGIPSGRFARQLTQLLGSKPTEVFDTDQLVGVKTTAIVDKWPTQNGRIKNKIVGFKESEMQTYDDLGNVLEALKKEIDGPF